MRFSDKRINFGLRSNIALVTFPDPALSRGKGSGAFSLVPRPPRPSAGDGLGALVDFLGIGARFWPNPIRSLALLITP